MLITTAEKFCWTSGRSLVFICYFNLQLNLQQFHKFRNILLTQCNLYGYPGTCGWLNDWVAPCFCLFLSVMRPGTRRAGSPLRVRWWAGTLWWLLMSGEHPEPLGWELAGCRVCPDGVSSGPCHPPSSADQLPCTQWDRPTTDSPSPITPNEDERCLVHQKYPWLPGNSERDPSLTFRVCLMARDGKVRF